jgi:hypothetical protein
MTAFKSAKAQLKMEKTTPNVSRKVARCAGMT